MNKKLLVGLAFFLGFCGSWAQQVKGSNPDEILERAAENYKNSRFEKALELANEGLVLAPEYHDIRILKIRVLWALDHFAEADAELDSLLFNASKYPDVQPLSHQRLDRFSSNPEKKEFISKLEKIYPNDIYVLISKADLLVQSGEREKGRKLARSLLKSPQISEEQKYRLRLILTRSSSDEIGMAYHYIGFEDIYGRSDWQHLSLEYQHNFNKTALIGRINYANRGYERGNLYEIEAYPVINDRFYGFVNLGFSDGEIFPDFRASVSGFYNFLEVFEAEAGGRLQYINNNGYFMGVAGISVYQGDFLINLKTFLGPERLGQLIQNYQFNMRYYLSNPNNYLQLRLGSGISPDEGILAIQKLNKPDLEAAYAIAGINFSLGVHHLFQVGSGLLYENISQDRNGKQYLANLSYRYRW